MGNTNGHPAPWDEFQSLAQRLGLLLIEDSTEALGSIYQGRPVGSFGDVSIFDFSQPGALVCGEGGMVVTDDVALASKIRQLRNRKLTERFSVIVGAYPPWQVGMSDLVAALGLAQLSRLEQILQRRNQIEEYYYELNFRHSALILASPERRHN